ncbi:hypothetical protein A3Q56_06533 [Intoshia linei]|uniref:Protein kinase domain-containing protein n=1 Tax=Intoshia linei TaxID=1819745 RepID=A0A177AUS3_9BILA|nr:hypothetical protein A3Q56_06533 [Intoshia linei]
MNNNYEDINCDIELLDKYKLTNVIGKGGCGLIYIYLNLPFSNQLKWKFRQVYKTICKDGPTVACKKILLMNDVISENVIAEISMLKVVDHVNIVKMKEYFMDEVEGCCYIFIIMELSLCNLGIFLREKKDTMIGIDRIIILEGVIRGLNYLHEIQIMHRDMKPSNILIGPKSNIRITDFDHATAFWNIESTDIFGTLGYRAPEIMLQAENYDEAVDIWSFGLICYNVATETSLFAKQTDSECLNSICLIMGPINNETWRGVEKLKGYHNINERKYEMVNFKRFLDDKMDDKDLMELISKTLCLLPSNRIGTKDILSMEYFQQGCFDI